MATSLPFLSRYDPPGASEGTLDPLGTYQIADQLAVQLVPAVRERMQRVRFLTAMAVGTLVAEDLDSGPPQRDAAPYLVWEWLVVEALVRARGDDTRMWGVAGSQVTRRAIELHGGLDARSYLKTPRIFGFHGIYKRLAHHLGIVDVHLAPGPRARELADVWARGQGLPPGGLESRIGLWQNAVRRSLGNMPPRSAPGWPAARWAELAGAFAPWECTTPERRYLRDLLHASGEQHLGAFSAIWALQPEFDDNEYREELLHDRLEEREPQYGPLLQAIRAYEAFSRSIQDAFDVLKAEAAALDARGFDVPSVAAVSDFQTSVNGLSRRFEIAHRALGEVGVTNVSAQALFESRFGAFAEPMDADSCALALCALHETVQRSKSLEGKRPWFDRIGKDRIYIRHQYREDPRPPEPGHYVHDYRGRPIRRFFKDLS